MIRYDTYSCFHSNKGEELSGTKFGTRTNQRRHFGPQRRFLAPAHCDCLGQHSTLVLPVFSFYRCRIPNWQGAPSPAHQYVASLPQLQLDAGDAVAAIVAIVAAVAAVACLVAPVAAVAAAAAAAAVHSDAPVVAAAPSIHAALAAAASAGLGSADACARADLQLYPCLPAQARE